jgi:hypothetical protein
VVEIVKHKALLEGLGLATLEQVKQFNGELVKNHRGHRDIFRIRTRRADGTELILFLKRNLKPYRKDGLTSLIRCGRVESLSRQEWDNSRLLSQAGLQTAPLVAYGEDCGLLWEKYSYLLTEAAPGQQTLEDFLQLCRDRALRRRVFDALAREIRKMHDAGLASPDLFSRHVFVDLAGPSPSFCLIDMARLNRGPSITTRTRARDLAALHATAPLRWVTTRERIRFLQVYAGCTDRRLVELIDRRLKKLLQRRKFKSFASDPDPSAGNPEQLAAERAP